MCSWAFERVCQFETVLAMRDGWKWVEEGVDEVMLLGCSHSVEKLWAAMVTLQGVYVLQVLFLWLWGSD